MRLKRLSLSIPLALLVAQFCLSVRAHADTYTILPLANDNRTVAGMDDLGHVVLDYSSTANCAGAMFPANCYYTFTDGVQTGVSSTLPSYTWDYSLGLGTVTRNGWIATLSPASDPAFENLFASSGTSAPQLVTSAHGLTNLLAIDGIGDIVFDNGLQDGWFEAIRVSPTVTPEPSSLLLMGTGILASFGLFRKRLSR